MASKMFKLQSLDFFKGAFVFVASIVLAKLASEMNVPGFDFVSYDWHSLLALASTAFVSYMAKQFLTDENGKTFGRIG